MARLSPPHFLHFHFVSVCSGCCQTFSPKLSSSFSVTVFLYANRQSVLVLCQTCSLSYIVLITRELKFCYRSVVSSLDYHAFFLTLLFHVVLCEGLQWMLYLIFIINLNNINYSNACKTYYLPQHFHLREMCNSNKGKTQNANYKGKINFNIETHSSLIIHNK